MISNRLLQGIAVVLNLALVSCSHSSNAPLAGVSNTFLSPATNQQLYVGTMYTFFGQITGQTSVTAQDQAGNMANCTYDPGTGFVRCRYIPPTPGSKTITMTASPSGTTVSQTFPNVSLPVGLFPNGDGYMWASFSVDTVDFAAVNSMTTPLNTVQAYKQDLNQSTGAGQANASSLPYINAAFASKPSLPSFAYLDWGNVTVGTQPSNYCANSWASTPTYDGNTQAGIAYCEQAIDTMVANPYFNTWGLPEEMDCSTPALMNVYTTLHSYIWAHDPRQRPTFVYIGSGEGPASIQCFTTAANLIAVGGYRFYNNAPNHPAWITWQVQSISDGISASGTPYHLPANPASKSTYDGNLRVPVNVIEDFQTGNTATTIIHDTFAGINAGAKAIIAYSWARDPSPGTADNPAHSGVQTAVNLVIGPENIGEWVIKGTHQSDLTVTKPAGSANIDSAVNLPGCYQCPATVSEPIVRAGAWDWAGERVIIAVNSSNNVIQGATFGGLPTGSPPALVVNENRFIAIVNGSIVDDFNPMQVHIYKVPLVAPN